MKKSIPKSILVDYWDIFIIWVLIHCRRSTGFSKEETNLSRSWIACSFVCVCVWALQKKCFSYLDFLSCFQPKYLKILKSVKYFFVVFRKNKSKLSEFLLRTSKIICQWCKQNNIISNRFFFNFAYPIGRIFCLFQAKTHLILTCFFWKQDNKFYLSRKSFLI